MRHLLLLLALGALSACGSESVESMDAAASVPTPLRGSYFASSETARALTGDVSVEPGGVMFARGVVLYTRVLNPRRGADVVSRNGDSYAAIAVGPSDLDIELRRVLEEVTPPGVAGLCGDNSPTYVAFAHDEHATRLTMMVFSGEEPPGPDARASRFCGAFAYVAPDGARTREGVLLW